MRDHALVPGLLLLTLVACTDGSANPFDPSADFPQMVVSSTDAYASTCDLGAVACGRIELIRGSYDYIAYASTDKTGPGVTSLFMSGYGTFQQGWGFPQLFQLHCATSSANSCPDSESFQHTCNDERNSVGLGTIHQATTATHRYAASLSESASCDPEFGGGGAGGGMTCDTEALIIEVYNSETGVWEYWGTETVVYCA